MSLPGAVGVKMLTGLRTFMDGPMLPPKLTEIKTIFVINFM